MVAIVADSNSREGGRFMCIATYAAGWRVTRVKSCVGLNEMGNVEQP
jgi:hypothetical protein